MKQNWCNGTIQHWMEYPFLLFPGENGEDYESDDEEDDEEEEVSSIFTWLFSASVFEKQNEKTCILYSCVWLKVYETTHFRRELGLFKSSTTYLLSKAKLPAKVDERYRTVLPVVKVLTLVCTNDLTL